LIPGSRARRNLARFCGLAGRSAAAGATRSELRERALSQRDEKAGATGARQGAQRIDAAQPQPQRHQPPGAEERTRRDQHRYQHFLQQWIHALRT